MGELDAIALGEGLTSGQATIVAACIALTAAVVAFLGVLVKARYDHRQHREKLEEDRAIRLRAEAVEALLEAMTAMTRAWEMVSSDNPKYPRDSDEYKDRDARYLACVMADAKLDVLGLREARDAMSAFTGFLAFHWISSGVTSSREDHRKSFKLVLEARQELSPAFQRSIAAIGESPAPRRGWRTRRSGTGREVAASNEA